MPTMTTTITHNNDYNDYKNHTPRPHVEGERQRREAPELAERGAEVGVRRHVRRAAVHLERDAERLRRLLRPLEPAQRVPQRVVRRRHARLQRRRHAVVLLGGGVPPERLLRVAEVVVPARVGRVELHREQQLRLRLLQPPRRLERDAEVRARRRHRRVLRHHLEHRGEVGLR